MTDDRSRVQTAGEIERSIGDHLATPCEEFGGSDDWNCLNASWSVPALHTLCNPCALRWLAGRLRVAETLLHQAVTVCAMTSHVGSYDAEMLERTADTGWALLDDIWRFFGQPGEDPEGAGEVEL